MRLRFKRSLLALIIIAPIILFLIPWFSPGLVHNTRVRFAGQIIDEAGKPVPNASIIIEVSSEKVFTLPIPWYAGRYAAGSNTRRVIVDSGPDGKFYAGSFFATHLTILGIQKLEY